MSDEAKKVDNTIVDMVERIEIALRAHTGLDFKVEEIVFRRNNEIVLVLDVYDGIDSYDLSYVIKEILNIEQLSADRFAIEHKDAYALLSVTYKIKGDKND